MTHKSREFQRVTSQMHVVSVHICVRCVRLGAHMALGVLGADRQGVGWRRGKAGDPLVPSVRVFCVA